MKIYLPLDSAAVALGADEIAESLLFQAQARGINLTLIRNGSRGMVWLEPMAEVVTDAGRMAFGPLTLADVPALFGDLAAHPKALGSDRRTALAEGADPADLRPRRRDRPAVAGRLQGAWRAGWADPGAWHGQGRDCR